MGAMKFANSCRQIKRDAGLDDTWHPLDGVTAPEYVPPSWDGPHVGKRLVDGLRTLMLMPSRAQSRSQTWTGHLLARSLFALLVAAWCAQVQAVAVARSRDSDTDGVARKLRSRRLALLFGAALDSKRTLRI
jgi:hypothetical protein